MWASADSNGAVHMYLVYGEWSRPSGVQFVRVVYQNQQLLSRSIIVVNSFGILRDCPLIDSLLPPKTDLRQTGDEGNVQHHIATKKPETLV